MPGVEWADSASATSGGEASGREGRALLPDREAWVGVWAGLR